MTVRPTRLADVASLDVERVRVSDDSSYRIAGVLNAGQGVFERELLQGSETSYEFLHRLRTSRIVMRKLTAFEGAITCVPPLFDGLFVSTEFPTYKIDETRLLPSFMAVVCQWPHLWEQMRLVSTGTVQRRKRVNPHALLSIQIPLPSLAVQHRIVDLVAAIDRNRDAVATVATEATNTAASARRELIESAAWDVLPLGELVTIESKLVDPTDPQHRDLPHVGIDRIESRTGRLLPLSSAADEAVTSGKFLFGPEDVIYAKIRPNLRKAAWPQQRGLASADAYPLRPRSTVAPGYLLHLLLSDQFSAEVTARSGRTKMPKVNRSELLSVAVPCPPPEDQRRIAGVLGALAGVGDLARQEHACLEALRAAVIDDLLTGNHAIPDEYDALLERTS